MRTLNNSYELYHHGIKGQKWGIRRYQNADGSLTNAGRSRHGDGSSQRKSGSGTGKKIAKGLAIGAAVGLTAYAIANPNSRQALANIGQKTISTIKSKATSPEVKEAIEKAGKKTVKGLSGSVQRTGKAMTDAALLSIGTIQIAKLSDKLATTENDSEAVRNRNKVILDTATAGIKAATNGNSGNKSNNSNSSKGGSVGKEVSDAIGSPSKKGIDKSSTDYQNLFKDSSGNQRDADTRATIKSMAGAGYDADQIKEYLRKVDDGSLKHSYDDIRDYLCYYSGKHYIDCLISIG